MMLSTFSPDPMPAELSSADVPVLVPVPLAPVLPVVPVVVPVVVVPMPEMEVMDGVP
jgi:hypothetical protein